MTRNLHALGRVAALIALGVAPAILSAQTATTGAISGTVRDGAGNTVAGATVTATSAQLSRSTVTAADGTYRLPLLNGGEWTIKAVKAGLSAPSQRISVLINNTTTVNLKVAGEAGAVVTVVASAAVMDLTTNQTGATLSVDSLNAIPKGRDFNGLVLLAPGTQSGGLMGGQSIAGASAIENSFLVDGLDTTDYRKGFQGAFMPTDFFDQVEVQTGGFRPEFSALGGVVNAITKSGTNEFLGSAWFTSDAPQLQARPVRTYYYNQGTPSYRYDFGFTAGGALVQDKVFYFVGVNQIDVEGLPQTNNIGLRNTALKDKTTNIYGKLNWYLAQNQQITATFNSVNEPVDYTHIYPTRGNRDTGYSQSNKTMNWSLNYDWTITPSLLLNAKYGSTSIEQHVTPTKIAPSITDYVWYAGGPGKNDGVVAGTAYVHGGIGDWADTDKGDNKQFRLDLSWFIGNHSLKFGYSNASATSFVNDLLAADDRVQINRSGTLLSSIYVTTYANLGSHAKISWNGYYAQDQWEIKPGFRLSYGFRLETQTVYGNNDKVFVKFTDVKDQLQPRIGITWDVNNDGKTKLSANYAIYQERFPMQASLRTAGNETYVQKRYRNQTGSTVSYNYATGDYAYSGSPYAVYDYSGYFRDYPQDLNETLKVPKRAEYILGFDKTLDSGWTVGVHAKYRKTLRIIEDTVPTDADGNYIDGEGFSILWNPQAGRTYRWANNKYHGDPGGINVWKNTVFPDPKNNYNSVDVTLDRKTDKYTVSLNYTLSHLYGNYEGVGQSSNGQADANITSTWDYYPYVGNGYLPLDRRHMFKAFGSYTWDLWGGAFAAGGTLTYTSGAPKSYFDNTNDIGGYGNATPENGMYGTRGRLPAQTVANLHFEYQYKFSKKMKLAPSIDIFNAFNSRTQTSWDQYGTTSGSVTNPAFGVANGWLAGRSYRWGAKLTF